MIEWRDIGRYLGTYLSVSVASLLWAIVSNGEPASRAEIGIFAMGTAILMAIREQRP